MIKDKIKNSLHPITIPEENKLLWWLKRNKERLVSIITNTQSNESSDSQSDNQQDNQSSDVAYLNLIYNDRDQYILIEGTLDEINNKITNSLYIAINIFILAGENHINKYHNHSYSFSNISGHITTSIYNNPNETRSKTIVFKGFNKSVLGSEGLTENWDIIAIYNNTTELYEINSVAYGNLLEENVELTIEEYNTTITGAKFRIEYD